MALWKAHHLQLSEPDPEQQKVSEAAVEVEMSILVRSGIENGDSPSSQAQGVKEVRVEVLHLAVAEVVAVISSLA